MFYFLIETATVNFSLGALAAETGRRILFCQAKPVLGFETEEDLLSWHEQFKMIDLDADFVMPDGNAAFDEVAEIDRVDHLALEQVYAI